MKKILYATTALIATTGMVAAEISIGGMARFGIGYIEDRGITPGYEDTIIISRFRLNIDAATETDAGVRFSARVRLQADEQSDGEAGALGTTGARFSVEHAGLRVDVGNVAGAIDNLPNFAGFEPGLESFFGQRSGKDYSDLAFSSNAAGANAIYVRYAFGDFAVAASHDQTDGIDDAGDFTGVDADRWDIHAAYTFGNITAGLAYGETDAGPLSVDVTVLTLAGEWGGFSGTLLVGDENMLDVAKAGTFYGLSGAFDLTSATTILASFGDGEGTNDAQAFGIGVRHDLGGGVSLRGGIGSEKEGDGASVTRADFGVNFSF